MKEFRKLNNLEEIKSIEVGEILGVGYIWATIPAVVLSNNGKLLNLLGNMDNKMIIKYNFKIDEIGGLYKDGSICTELDGSKFIGREEIEYEPNKTLLINWGIWEEQK